MAEIIFFKGSFYRKSTFCVVDIFVLIPSKILIWVSRTVICILQNCFLKLAGKTKLHMRPGNSVICTWFSYWPGGGRARPPADRSSGLVDRPPQRGQPVGRPRETVTENGDVLCDTRTIISWLQPVYKIRKAQDLLNCKAMVLTLILILLYCTYKIKNFKNKKLIF